MSALERLTAYLCSNPGSEHMDEEYAAFAARLLRQHAHELAEAIRARAPLFGPSAIRTAAEGRAYGRMIGLREGADLIDPEVE